MYGNTIYFTRMVDEDMGQHVLFYDASFPYAGQRPDERALAELNAALSSPMRSSLRRR
jgi:hypothetical protein